MCQNFNNFLLLPAEALGRGYVSHARNRGGHNPCCGHAAAIGLAQSALVSAKSYRLRQMAWCGSLGKVGPYPAPGSAKRGTGPARPVLHFLPPHRRCVWQSANCWLALDHRSQHLSASVSRPPVLGLPQFSTAKRRQGGDRAIDGYWRVSSQSKRQSGQLCTRPEPTTL